MAHCLILASYIVCPQTVLDGHPQRSSTEILLCTPLVSLELECFSDSTILHILSTHAVIRYVTMSM